MNQKMLAIAAIVTAAALTGIFSTTPMAAYAGGMETKVKPAQTNHVKQKNTEVVTQPTSTVAKT